MRAEAIAAAGSSISWEEYASKLRAKGIVVKERFSEQSPGEIPVVRSGTGGLL